MKKSIILCNFLFLNLVLLGQNDYFLFLQSENNQPYYVQSDDKTLSSSSIGHLIIPRLKDSIYTLTIGFPGNQFPEQVFRLRMSRKDAGYQLKNLGMEGWGLYNFQTSESIKGKVVESKKQTVNYGDIRKTDVFSTLMAGLVNDSAILYTSIARVEPVKADSKSSISDARSANIDVTKQEDILKKDSPLSKTEIVSAQVSNKDTISKIQVSQPLETSKNDTLIAKTDLVKQNDSLKESPLTTSSVVPKEDKPKTDTLLTSNVSTRENDFSKKDSALAKADLVKEGERKDTFASKDVSQKPSPATDSKIPELPVKPIIVQVSETKTSKGTEIIFLDQSAAGINDTITILIVKEKLSSNEPGILKEDVPEKDDQKNSSGGFFGKVFSKKKKSPAPKTESDSKPQPGQNTSTMKVSTVETKKTVDSPVVKSEKSKKNQRSKKETTVLKADEDKNGEDENFLNKVFRKKNKEKAIKEENNSKTVSGDVVSIKVTTVESSPGSNIKEESKVVVTNSDCRAFASDTDVDKLRLRMLGENDADGQVNEARKVFKQKCFSTNQVKTLSSLFRNDEGKYKLLDAAYPYVSDSRNFKELVTLLTEEYYINRFKAMVRM